MKDEINEDMVLLANHKSKRDSLFWPCSKLFFFLNLQRNTFHSDHIIFHFYRC